MNCALFVGFLTFCWASEEVPKALDADDQCASADCAVNALQHRVKGLVEPVGLPSLDASEEELLGWHPGYYGHVPKADISKSNYQALMLNISTQQGRIMTLWNRSVDLEKDVQTLVKQVEEDSGLHSDSTVALLFGAVQCCPVPGLKVADFIALVESARSSSEQAKGQPREAAVRKWLSYMDKEMGLIFNKLNKNGQQVAAAGTLMSKNPVPLKLQNQTFDSLAQTANATNATEPVMPGDHVGVGDELWRSVIETVTNIHTANTSANNLQDHIQKINKMLVDFNEGKLIPNEG